MRPTFFIHHLQLVITTGGKQTAYRYMHQILFLFLRKLCLEIAHFLYADEEKNRFHIRFFSKPGHQLFFQRPPPALDIIFHVHPAKITRLGIYRLHRLPLRKFSVMLQLAVIRQQPEFIKKRLLVKNFDASAAIGKILELDEQRKRLQLEIESEQAGLNVISKEIGQLIAKGEKTRAEERKQQV